MHTVPHDPDHFPSTEIPEEAGPALPYAVEITGMTTLVIAPNTIAVLIRTHHSDDGPDRYEVLDTDGGGPYEIRADDTVSLHVTKIGVLHHRCGYNPEGLAQFETEPQALAYARHALTRYWPCDQLLQD